ncbi:MAG: YkvA family protein [Rhodospirillales bacterium]
MDNSEQQKYARDNAAIDAGFWPKLRRGMARIPFAEEAIAAYYAMRDPATPTYVKALLAGALAYFVMPIDLIPDFIFGLGYTDDAAVLFGAVQTVRKHIQPAHRDRAKAALDELRDGKDPTPAH